MKLSFDDKYFLVSQDKNLLIIDVKSLAEIESIVTEPKHPKDFDYIGESEKIIFFDRDLTIYPSIKDSKYIAIRNPHNTEYYGTIHYKISLNKPLFLTWNKKCLKIWCLKYHKSIARIITPNDIDSANFVNQKKYIVIANSLNIDLYSLTNYRKLSSIKIGRPTFQLLNSKGRFMKYIENLSHIEFRVSHSDSNRRSWNALNREIIRLDHPNDVYGDFEMVNESVAVILAYSSMEIVDKQTQTKKIHHSCKNFTYL